MLPGGWSGYSSEITAEQKKILVTALEHHVGVNYDPIGIQHQVVAGTNYCYYCISKIVVPDSDAYLSKVTVWVNPQGEVKLTGIDAIHP